VPAESDGRKTTPRIHVPAPDLAVEPEPEREPELESEATTDATAGVDGTLDGQPKRKRSRRGTRGGRKRKKPAAANGGTSEETEPAETADVAGAVAEEPPAEYVPMSEWIEDFDSRPRGR
jgi:hypothetical protein